MPKMYHELHKTQHKEKSEPEWERRKPYTPKYLLCATFTYIISLNIPSHPTKGLLPSMFTGEETEVWRSYSQSLTAPVWESVA